MNEKSLNSIYPNLWAPTAGLLQGLTVMQQGVIQIKFRNVCEVKNRLVQYGLVSMLLSMNAESVSSPMFALWANTSNNFTSGSKNRQVDEMSASVRNVKNVFLRVVLIKQSYCIG